MPTYEYKCEPCRVIIQTIHGINAEPLGACPKCEGPVERMISAPSLNLKGFDSPTEEKYSKMSETEELARERMLQGDFQTIWLPPFVKHDPEEEH